MLGSTFLSTHKINGYEQFSTELQKIAALGNDDNLALVIRGNDGAEGIEIKTATLWDRVVKWLGWRCFGGEEYQESEVQTVMRLFLDNNDNFLEQAFKDRNCPLLNVRIFKYIPNNYFHDFWNARMNMIETSRSNLNSRSADAEIEVMQANIRKGQIEDEIQMLESTRNQLISEHKKNYDKMIQAIPVHEPNSNRKLPSKMEALRKDTKCADITFISSDGKKIHAHSALLNDDTDYFTNFMIDSNFFIKKHTQSEKCKFYFKELRFNAETINNFLDLKYGIPLNEKLTQAQTINLLYFANYVLDESLKNELVDTLFKNLNKANFEALLPGLFHVALDFTNDLTKQDSIFDQFMKLLVDLENPSIKSEYFKKLSNYKDFNNPNINFWLGVCHKLEIGVAIDEHKAFMSYQLAAEKGLAAAQSEVGYCFENGIGVEKNLEKAFHWYKLAADQGFAKAQYNLGPCYKDGKGVEENLEMGLYWIRLAADQGLPKAQNHLGVYFYTGTGVEKNLEKAFYWCKLAAVQGLATAQYNIGIFYETGNGVKKNEAKAMKWFEKAAAQGNKNAKEALSRYEL